MFELNKWETVLGEIVTLPVRSTQLTKILSRYKFRSIWQVARDRLARGSYKAIFGTNRVNPSRSQAVNLDGIPVSCPPFIYFLRSLSTNWLSQPLQQSPRQILQNTKHAQVFEIPSECTCAHLAKLSTKARSQIFTIRVLSPRTKAFD